MVVSNREIVNKYPFNSSAMSSLNDTNNVLEDININSPRGRSNIISQNFSREHSTVSSISNMAYSKQMEIQNDNTS